jgi:hypothetical protein
MPASANCTFERSDHTQAQVDTGASVYFFLQPPDSSDDNIPYYCAHYNLPDTCQSNNTFSTPVPPGKEYGWVLTSKCSASGGGGGLAGGGGGNGGGTPNAPCTFLRTDGIKATVDSGYTVRFFNPISPANETIAYECSHSNLTSTCLNGVFTPAVPAGVEFGWVLDSACPSGGMGGGGVLR